MTRKLVSIVLILCITGVLVVAGIRFFGPAGVPTDTLPAEQTVTPVPETAVATPLPAAGDGITAEEAKTIAVAVLPGIVRQETADVRIETIQDALGERRLFEVSDYTTALTSPEARKAQVWVNARTGQVDGFCVHASNNGRPVEPVLTMEEACAIAGEYLEGLGETTGLADAVGRCYSPYTIKPAGTTVAGFYAVRFSRLVRGVPCIWDGCDVNVDAVTGEIRRYNRLRVLDEARCLADTGSAITTGEAEERVGAYLRDVHGELPELTFDSAALVWADNLAPTTGAVPLAWKITFDDDYYRSLESPQTAAAFVDAVTGEVLSCDYRRDRHLL